MITGYAISIPEIQTVDTLRRSIKSTESDIQLKVAPATTPDTIEFDIKYGFQYFDPKNFKWNWPMDNSADGLDMATGLYKFAYGAKDQQKKIACSVSHMLLWDKCVILNTPILIFESDAVLTRKFELDEVDGPLLVGLNDPRGATRRGQLFHDKVSSSEGIKPTPTVNLDGDLPVPQGLAGNSAYYITPEAAKELLDKVSEYGMYPNDAYMCRELFPWLRVVYPYFTKVQGTVSTTTR